MSNEERKPFGEFGHVLLSDRDIEILKERYPNLFEQYIEEVDGYCESTGKKYKNYRATVQNWIRRDKKSGKLRNKGSISRKPTYDIAAIKAKADTNTTIRYK